MTNPHCRIGKVRAKAGWAILTVGERLPDGSYKECWPYLVNEVGRDVRYD